MLVIEQSEKLSDSSKRVYRNAVGEWLDFAGETPSGWNLSQAQTWYKTLCARIAVKSANSRIAALKYASQRWAALSQRPDLDFAGALETRRDSSVKAIRSLSRDEAARLLDACAGRKPVDMRDYAAVTLGLRTGMRRMSLVGSRLDKMEPTPEGVMIEVPIKGGVQHKVPLDETTLYGISPWVQYLKSSKITTGPIFRACDQATIPDEGLGLEGLWKTLKRRAKKAEIPNFTPHVMRHTFVTWCREAGVPDYQIAAVTGHKGSAGLERILGVYTDKNVGWHAVAAIPVDLWNR